MRWPILAGIGLWTAMAGCSGDAGSPVGGDLLPGGVLGDGLEVIALSDFTLAESYEIFPADRAEADRLVSASAWPDETGFESRPILRFSLTQLDSLTPDTQILEASLDLVFLTVEEPVEFRVHRVIASWTEEAATWDRRDLGLPWAQPGGDFDPVPVAELTIEAGEPDSAAVDSVSVPLPPELVADWLFGSQGNDGLILVQQTPGAAVEFVSAGQGGLNPSGPRLQFLFQPPTPGAPSADVSVLAREDTFLAAGGEAPVGDIVVSAGADVRRALLVPDLGALPDGTVVARAQLVLPVDGAIVPGDSIGIVAGRVVSVFRGEKTILAAPSGIDFFGLVTVERDSLPVDSLLFESPFLTSAVRQWLREPESNLGLYLIIVNEAAAFGAMGFAGAGSSLDRRPHLRLVVVPAGEDGVGS